MTLDLPQRKKRFVSGFTIAWLPVALWTALPDALLVKIADALKLDERPLSCLLLHARLRG
jgi:hypothetical protein